MGLKGLRIILGKVFGVGLNCECPLSQHHFLQGWGRGTGLNNKQQNPKCDSSSFSE